MAIAHYGFVVECKYCLSRYGDGETIGYLYYDTTEQVDKVAKSIDWVKVGEHEHVCVPCAKNWKHRDQVAKDAEQYLIDPWDE